jgi:hypothetical protein
MFAPHENAQHGGDRKTILIGELLKLLALFAGHAHGNHALAKTFDHV